MSVEIGGEKPFLTKLIDLLLGETEIANVSDSDFFSLYLLEVFIYTVRNATLKIWCLRTFSLTVLSHKPSKSIAKWLKLGNGILLYRGY